MDAEPNLPTTKSIKFNVIALLSHREISNLTKQLFLSSSSSLLFLLLFSSSSLFAILSLISITTLKKSIKSTLTSSVISKRNNKFKSDKKFISYLNKSPTCLIIFYLIAESKFLPYNTAGGDNNKFGHFINNYINEYFNIIFNNNNLSLLLSKRESLRRTGDGIGGGGDRADNQQKNNQEKKYRKIYITLGIINYYNCNKRIRCHAVQQRALFKVSFE